MRHLIGICLIVLAGCPAPREGSTEWVARHYTEALLESNTKEMQRYAAQGIQVAEAKRNPRAASLHVIKVCPKGQSEDGSRQNYVVLIGGKLDGTINGVDMVLVQEGSQWRVLDARLSVDERGAKNYLRNCQEDTRLAL